ncbi:MAG: hypothetical protein ABIR70_10690 [Bryobacteraceae bacterium]
MKVVVFVLCALFARADDLSDAYDALKRAEALRDATNVHKYAVETSRLARIQIAAQVPPAIRDSYQKEREIYLTQTDTYTEYSMAVAASYPNTAPEVIAQLVDAIILQTPKSDYLALAVPPYLASLTDAAQLAAAEKILKLQPENEDALLALTDGNLRAKQYPAAERYAAELLAVMSGKTRPERYSVEAWREKKAQMVTRVHFNAGVSACAQQAWQTCDVHFRAVTVEPAIEGQVSFYLGLANYQLAKATPDRARMEQALKFSRQAAATPGPTQSAAQQNVAAIQQELAKK